MTLGETLQHRQLISEETCYFIQEGKSDYLNHLTFMYVNLGLFEQSESKLLLF